MCPSLAKIFGDIEGEVQETNEKRRHKKSVGNKRGRDSDCEF
jgi:hypothetical protein